MSKVPHTTSVYPAAEWYGEAFKKLEIAARKQPNGDELADNHKLTMENLQLRALSSQLG